ncbi:MAG: HEAT repeat domain-containing protein [Anaerolineales bacterium]
MAGLDEILARLTGGVDDEAERAVAELSALRPAPLTQLSHLGESSDPDHRWWATRAIAAIPGTEATAALIRALQDEAREVRQCAAVGLRGNASAEAISPLVAVLGDEDRLVARLAGDSLASVGEAAVDALAKAARSDSAAVRIEAVRALAQARVPQAIPALFHALDDPSTVVAYWADQGLETLGVGMTFFKP